MRSVLVSMIAVSIALLVVACSGATPLSTAAARLASSASEDDAVELRDAPPLEPALESAVALEAAAPSMRAHFIDVGQGAATLLEFPCGAVLIDTGGERQPGVPVWRDCDRDRPQGGAPTFDSTALLLRYLTDFFATRPDLNSTLDVVYLTHPHIDHTRGVLDVMERFEVRNLVTNGLNQGSGTCEQQHAERLALAASETRLRRLRNPERAWGVTSDVIDPIACDSVDPQIRVLFGRVQAPRDGWSQEEMENENNHSLVIRVDFGAFSMLVTGDLQDQGIEDLLEQSDPRVLDVDLYQVGHHGSHNATTQPLMDAMTPAIAVMGMGSHDREEPWTAWRYGHPRLDIVNLLRGVSGTREPVEVHAATGMETFETVRVSEAIYGTGWDGTVVVRATRDGRFEVE